MITVGLPADLGAAAQAWADAEGVSSDEVVARALRREADARRLFAASPIALRRAKAHCSAPVVT